MSKFISKVICTFPFLLINFDVVSAPKDYDIAPTGDCRKYTEQVLKKRERDGFGAASRWVTGGCRKTKDGALEGYAYNKMMTELTFPWVLIDGVPTSSIALDSNKNGEKSEKYWACFNRLNNVETIRCSELSDSQSSYECFQKLDARIESECGK